VRSTLSIGRPAVAQRKIWGVETASSRLALFLLKSVFENKPTPPYTYGLGKVDTTSGSEHTMSIQPDRTEQR
jgi:hypothetical protein